MIEASRSSAQRSEARLVAKVVGSSLVKTAMFGEDPIGDESLRSRLAPVHTPIPKIDMWIGDQQLLKQPAARI